MSDVHGSRPFFMVCTPALALALAAVAPAMAQVRVANWNVTGFDTASALASGRGPDFQNAFYGVTPNGQRFMPDIIIGEEYYGTTAVAAFVGLLNSYPGGPTDWQAAPYVENSSLVSSNPGQALFYRSSKITLVGPTVMLTAGTGTCATCPPRDTARWLVRLAGYAAPAVAGTGPEMYIYGAHMKAGSTTADQDRRTPEAIRIRNDSNTFPAGANFVLGGDFNTQASTQTAWVRLTEVGANANGKFADPINTPGSWNNTCSFKYVFTQDPALNTSGGFDDRMDFVLISDTLHDGAGMDYIGDVTVNYNTVATARAAASQLPWDVPQHSFRCWGNDGTACNGNIALAGNTMVGTSVAQSLAATALSGGHLPVFLDVRVPARISAPATVNFGTVNRGSTATATITVTNATDVRAFARDPINAPGAGIANLSYTFGTAPAGYSIVGGSGPFILSPAAQPALPAAQVYSSRTHTISLNTSTPGTFSGSITITNNSIDTPAITVHLTGTVVAGSAACSLADIVGIGGNPPADGLITGDDFNAFIGAFAQGDTLADVVGIGGNPPPDGLVTGDDFNAFIAAFASGCP